MSTIYTSQQLLDLSHSDLCKNPEFLEDAIKFSQEMKSSRLYVSKLQKKKSLSFDRHRSGRELKFVGDENAIIDEPHHSSNEEEEGADIDANEMTSRLQRNIQHVKPPGDYLSIPPKFATAYAASKSVKEEAAHHHEGSPSNNTHHRPRRYSSNKGQKESAVVADEEDGSGWISVGPKHHHHHHQRKSFNHDDAHHHRKKFNETNRQARSSFSNGNANRERKAFHASVAAVPKENKPVIKAEGNGKEISHPTESAIADGDDVAITDEKPDDSDTWITPKKTVRRPGSNLDHAGSAIHA